MTFKWNTACIPHFDISLNHEHGSMVLSFYLCLWIISMFIMFMFQNLPEQVTLVVIGSEVVCITESTVRHVRCVHFLFSCCFVMIWWVKKLTNTFFEFVLMFNCYNTDRVRVCVVSWAWIFRFFLTVELFYTWYFVFVTCYICLLIVYR